MDSDVFSFAAFLFLKVIDDLPNTAATVPPRIGMESNTKENFPVLCTVLQNPLISILPLGG